MSGLQKVMSTLINADVISTNTSVFFETKVHALVENSILLSSFLVRKTLLDQGKTENLFQCFRSEMRAFQVHFTSNAPKFHVSERNVCISP